MKPQIQSLTVKLAILLTGLKIKKEKISVTLKPVVPVIIQTQDRT